MHPTEPHVNPASFGNSRHSPTLRPAVAVTQRMRQGMFEIRQQLHTETSSRAACLSVGRLWDGPYRSLDLLGIDLGCLFEVLKTELMGGVCGG